MDLFEFVKKHRTKFYIAILVSLGMSTLCSILSLPWWLNMVCGFVIGFVVVHEGTNEDEAEELEARRKEIL